MTTLVGNHWIEWRKNEDTAKLQNADPAVKATGYATADILSDEYRDAGYWGRHYSTVRMTLGTFFMTAAFALMINNLDKPSHPVGIAAIAVAVAGIIVFLGFTALTFQEMNKQRSIVVAYRNVLKPPPQGQSRDADNELRKLNWATEWTGGIIALGFVVMFVAFAAFWWRGAFAPTSANSNTTQLEIDVSVGNSKPVPLKVPVKFDAKPQAAETPKPQ